MGWALSPPALTSQTKSAVAPKTRRFGKREVVVREGEPAKALYRVREGVVALVRTLVDGREAILGLLAPGDFFGEESLVGAESTGARALTNVVLEAIALDPSLCYALYHAAIASLVKRLQASNRLAVALACQSVSGRLADLLLDLAARFGVQAEHGTHIALRLTQQQLADMIGTNRETVNRYLGQFQDASLISLRTRDIAIVNAEGLREIALTTFP